MSGPPNNASALATAVYGGVGIPHGAVTTIGIGAPADAGERSAVADAIATGLTAWASADIKITAVEIKIGPEATGPTYIEARNVPGGNTDVAVNPNTAVLVRKVLTDFSNKLAGRMFCPGIPENVVDSAGLITASYVTGIQDDMDTMFDALVSITGAVFVFPEASSTARNVTSLDVQSVVATQRQRLRR